jgi:hypothetical protein
MAQLQPFCDECVGILKVIMSLLAAHLAMFSCSMYAWPYLEGEMTSFETATTAVSHHSAPVKH